MAVADQELFSSSPFKTGVAVMIGMIFGLMGFVACLANMIVTCQ